MKKFLLLLTVLALLSGSVFAGVTSVTKENSQAGYPGVLTAGSVVGTSTFISDLPLLTNIVMLEYVGDIYGIVTLKTDFGAIGLSISPSISPFVRSIGGNNLDTVGIQYATTLSSMPVGASILYGNDSWAYENKDIVNNAAATGSITGNDKENTADSYVALKLGAALKGSMAIDLALGIAMDNSYSRLQNINNVANGVVIGDVTADQSILGFDLSGRIDLGNNLKAVLGGTFNMGTDKDTTLTYDNAGTKTGDTVATETNNYLTVGALIGKDIKATDTLTIKIASGAAFWTNQDARNETKYNLPAAPTAYDTGARWSQVYINVPLNVAVEGKLNDTWSINAGASATVFSTQMDTTKNNAAPGAYDPQPRYAQTWLNVTPGLDYAVGVTGKIGDLTIDLNVNPMIILNGPYLLSGTDTANLNIDLALGYAWK